MDSQSLVIKVKCRANEQCLFENKDMFLDIGIINNQNMTIGFPLEYVQKTGPIIKLIDSRTKAETYLKRNLADPNLQDKFTSIKPGESVTIEWVITADELRKFGDDVDLSAEVTIMARILVNGLKVDFSGSGTQRIISKKRN